MSLNWHIRCIDCSVTLTFDDAPSREWMLEPICRSASAIADLAETVDGLSLKVYSHELDLGWFAQHRGHKLRPIDEYGTLSGERATWRCPRCQLTYGAMSDSTVAHRERGLQNCIACTEQMQAGSPCIHPCGNPECGPAGGFCKRGTAT